MEPAPKKIVIADDEPDILKVVVFRLKKQGFEVITATDGKEALETVQRERPDAVLLDLRMPFMDGDEVCRRIKSDQEMGTIPVLLVTASLDSVRDAVKDSGADGVILKPFDPAELIEKVKKLIAGIGREGGV